MIVAEPLPTLPSVTVIAAEPGPTLMMVTLFPTTLAVATAGLEETTAYGGVVPPETATIAVGLPTLMLTLGCDTIMDAQFNGPGFIDTAPVPAALV